MTDDTKKAEHEARKAANTVPADWPAEKYWPAKYVVDNAPYFGIFDSESALREFLGSLTSSELELCVHPNSKRRIKKEYEGAVDSAESAYSAAVAPAQKVNDANFEAARLTYEAAVASARETYAAALAPTRSACEAVVNSENSTATINSAREAYHTAHAGARVAYEREYDVAQAAYYETRRLSRVAYDAAIAPAKEAREAVLTAADIRYKDGLIKLIKPSLADWRDVIRADISGKRAPVWQHAPFWRDNESVWRDHFVAISDKDSALLAYVQSPEKGQRGIRTPIKPGRYLAQFFGHLLTAKQIAMYAAWQTTGAKPNEYMDADSYAVSLATEPDDIVRVYLRGPSSCMSHDDSSYRCGGHPTRVYGAGDLAIAYLHAADDKDKIFARALVWPAKKVVSRIYPNASSEDNNDRHHALKAHFEALGYESLYNNYRALNGARVLRIKSDYGSDTYVMPYLDVISRCNVLRHDDGTASDDYLILQYEGGYDAQNTTGCVYIPAHEFTQHNDSEDEPGWTCERCGEWQTEDDSSQEVVVSMRSNARINRTENWCPYCYENHSFYCEGLEHQVSAEQYHSIGVDGAYYSDRWLENNAVWSDYSERWYIGVESRFWDGMTVTDDEYKTLKAERDAADAESESGSESDAPDEIEIDEAA